jgi:hypothetical protein
MTVGAVEPIADIGSGILLRIGDNLIAKPDLFTQLTAWNSVGGRRSEFYRRANSLAGRSKLVGRNPSLFT